MEGLSLYKFPPSDKNLKWQWLIKIKHARLCHAYCFNENPTWKRMRFQLALNKTQPPLTHRRLRHFQRTNINKTMLSVSPSSAFHTKFAITIKMQIILPS